MGAAEFQNTIKGQSPAVVEGKGSLIGAGKAVHHLCSHHRTQLVHLIKVSNNEAPFAVPKIALSSFLASQVFEEEMVCRTSTLDRGRTSDACVGMAFAAAGRINEVNGSGKMTGQHGAQLSPTPLGFQCRIRVETIDPAGQVPFENAAGDNELQIFPCNSGGFQPWEYLFRNRGLKIAGWEWKTRGCGNLHASHTHVQGPTVQVDSQNRHRHTPFLLRKMKKQVVLSTCFITILLISFYISPRFPSLRRVLLCVRD